MHFSSRTSIMDNGGVDERKREVEEREREMDKRKSEVEERSGELQRNGQRGLSD